MIGHTMPASGAASLIKMALSLYHKILPPTLCDGDIADGLKNSSFYLNTSTRPWVHSVETRRRAGINAFGFGGINGHAILEEYENNDGIHDLVMDWPMELFLLAGNTVDELQMAIHHLIDEQKQYRDDNKRFGLLSRDVCQAGNKFLDYRLAIIAENYESLSGKLRKALKWLKSTQGKKRIATDGIFFEIEPLKKKGKIAFVFPGNAFPGLGDDYTDRLGELCLYFPFFRVWFDRLEQEKILEDKSYRFSTMLFPPTKIDHEKFVRLKKELRILDHSASGVFLANTAGHDLISRLDVHPDVITGTSLGEWSAAVAAGMIDLNQIAEMKAYAQSDNIDKIVGAVGLAQCPLETLQPYLDEFNRDETTVTCAMDLSPQQVVYAGTREAVERFCQTLNDSGLWSSHLNLFPIHTPLCKPIADHIHQRLEGLRVSEPTVPVYSAATNEPFPRDDEEMRRLLADNAVLPVHMRSLFLKLYNKGVRIFLQLGGGGKIKAPIHETLGDKPFTILSLDVSHRHPIHQLQHVLAALYAHHTEIKTDLLYASRFRCLERSAAKKRKQSELVIKLKTSIPKYEIKNEQLRLERETGDPMKTATRDKNQQPKPTMPSGMKAISPSSASKWEALLCEQMNTMTRLFALQKEDELADMAHFTNMMQCQAQFILSSGGDNMEPSTFPNADHEGQEESLPFVGHFETHVHNKKVVIRRTLSLESDLFMKDHAFIPCPDHIKPPEEKLPALPMAVALEMISEAAQTLFPDKIVCGLKNIKNKKWISLTETVREKELIISAEAKNADISGEIEVDCTIAVQGDVREIYFTGDVLLADHHYAYDKNLSIGGELKAAHSYENVDPGMLYRPGGLYHGPCFRGLKTILKTTDKGVESLLTVPSLDGFFAGHSGQSMILPVQTIDAASQQIYCYDIAMNTRNAWVAPVSIERILIYKPAPMPGCEVSSKMIIRGNDNNLVRFDVLLEANGEIFMIIIGWRDWRMKWSDRLFASWQDPTGSLLARKKQNRTPVSKDYFTVYSVESRDLFGIDPDWLARLYLNSSEYRDWHDSPRDRKKELLMEFVAAKDAVRGLLRKKNQVLYPSQVVTKKISKGQFSIGVVNGSQALHSSPISVLTAGRENEIVAMAISEQIEEMPELQSDIFDGEWREFIMSNYV
jgi:malonyl CoA-acyl carrier protein transacylase